MLAAAVSLFYVTVSDFDFRRLSLASTLSNWRIENDRKYHAYRSSSHIRTGGARCQRLTESGDGAYWAPHDEQSLKLDEYAYVDDLANPN